MCLYTPGCYKNTGTLLSGRLEINQRDGGGLGADTGRMCLHTPGCSRNTQTLLSGRLEINQRSRGLKEIKAECAFTLLVVPKPQALFYQVG